MDHAKMSVRNLVAVTALLAATNVAVADSRIGYSAVCICRGAFSDIWLQEKFHGKVKTSEYNWAEVEEELPIIVANAIGGIGEDERIEDIGVLELQIRRRPSTNLASERFVRSRTHNGAIWIDYFFCRISPEIGLPYELGVVYQYSTYSKDSVELAVFVPSDIIPVLKERSCQRK